MRSSRSNRRAAKLALLLPLLAALVATPAHARKASSEERAAEIFQQGNQHFKVGHYALALEAFQRAYLLTPDVNILYSIAQAQRLSGNLTEARTVYERVLRESPPPELAEKARGHLKTVKDELDGKQRAEQERIRREQARHDIELVEAARAQAAASKPAPEAKPPLYKRPWFWGVIGGVAGVAVAGVVTGVVLGSRRSTELVGVDTRVVTFPGD